MIEIRRIDFYRDTEYKLYWEGTNTLVGTIRFHASWKRWYYTSKKNIYELRNDFLDSFNFDLWEQKFEFHQIFVTK